MKLSMTKASVEALPFPEKGQQFHYDTKLQGFGVCCGKTAKTYFAEGRVGGKTVRTSIGRHGVIFPDEARTRARELLVQMSRGENPNAPPAVEAPGIDEMTLKKAIDTYIDDRSSKGEKIKEKTKAGYEWLRDGPLKKWHDLKIGNFNRQSVLDIHAAITETSGPVSANNALRMVRAALTYLDVEPNPVQVLTRKRMWNAEKRASRYIESSAVSDWIKAAEKLDIINRGLILTMLLLGMRKQEVLTMTKSQYRHGALYLSDTKNNDEHLVPVGPYLQARLDPLMKLEGPWLFPSGKSESGHVEDPRKAIASLGLKVSPHDLRRTFVSSLNALDPAPSTYTIKRLMNHRQSSADDVTVGYIQIEAEKLRSVIMQLEVAMVGTASTTQ